jgi:hypothetical protein
MGRKNGNGRKRGAMGHRRYRPVDVQLRAAYPQLRARLGLPRKPQGSGRAARTGAERGPQSVPAPPSDLRERSEPDCRD